MFYRSPDPAFRVILSVSEGSSHFRKRKDSSSLRSSEWQRERVNMKSMPKQGSFLCHPERQRRIFAPSKVNRFFVTAFLRMTKGGWTEKILRLRCSLGMAKKKGGLKIASMEKICYSASRKRHLSDSLRIQSLKKQIWRFKASESCRKHAGLHTL